MSTIYKQQTSVGGQRITYYVAGSGAGEPVILVHGLSGSMRWWRHTVPALARQYRVYLLDLPGFGTMRQLGPTFVLREAADWLASWMSSVGIEHSHLVGHSMGAYICLGLAAQYGEQVSRLALVNPAGVPTGRHLLGNVISLASEMLLSSPALLPLLFHDALRAGPRTLWRVTRELLQEDIRSQLGRVTAPTLIIWGEKDVLVPPSAGVVLRHEIVNSRLLVIPRARHVPMLDRPREFNLALLEFLRGDPVGD